MRSRRRNPAQRALEARVRKAVAECRKLHPKGDIVTSLFGRELVVNVVGGPGYRDTMPDTDPVEASFTTGVNR